jgi:hypothetical protein
VKATASDKDYYNSKNVYFLFKNFMDETNVYALCGVTLHSEVTVPHGVP